MQPTTSAPARELHYYHPTPADERYRLALACKGVWLYDRSDRLTAVLARVRGQQEYLLRSRCEAADLAEVRAIDARLAALDDRKHRLEITARKVRRHERSLEQLSRQETIARRLDFLLGPKEEVGPEPDLMLGIGACG